LVADLSDEIAAGMKDGLLPPLAVDRIWIGDDDRARLLDFTPPAFAADTLRPAGFWRSRTVPRRSKRAEVSLRRRRRRAARREPGHRAEEPLAMRSRSRRGRCWRRSGAATMASADEVRTHAELQLRNPASHPVKRRATQIAVCAALRSS
jgi:hypothetical protein